MRLNCDFIDPFGVPDIFSESLASVEDIGGAMRYTFASEFRGETTAVCRLVIPTLAIPAARLLSGAAYDRAVTKILHEIRVSH